MADLVKRVADDIYKIDSTDTYAIARVAIKALLDDMREWNPTTRGGRAMWKHFLDAYERDRR